MIDQPQTMLSTSVMQYTVLIIASVDAPSARASVATAIQLKRFSTKSMNTSQTKDLHCITDVGLGLSQHRPVIAVTLQDICDYFGVSRRKMFGCPATLSKIRSTVMMCYLHIRTSLPRSG